MDTIKELQESINALQSALDNLLKTKHAISLELIGNDDLDPADCTLCREDCDNCKHRYQVCIIKGRNDLRAELRAKIRSL
jgi:hypothetical protein